MLYARTFTGFTPMCKQLPPAVVMSFLHTLFSRFDAMLDEYAVYKVGSLFASEKFQVVPWCS